MRGKPVEINSSLGSSSRCLGQWLNGLCPRRLRDVALVYNYFTGVQKDVDIKLLKHEVTLLMLSYQRVRVIRIQQLWTATLLKLLSE